MNTISHSDYCPESNTGSLEDCDSCMARLEQQQEYYGKQYRSRYRYTREEIEDVYQDDEHKREVMLHELGL